MTFVLKTWSDSAIVDLLMSRFFSFFCSYLQSDVISPTAKHNNDSISMWFTKLCTRQTKHFDEVRNLMTHWLYVFMYIACKWGTTLPPITQTPEFRETTNIHQMHSHSYIVCHTALLQYNLFFLSLFLFLCVYSVLSRNERIKCYFIHTPNRCHFLNK